MPRKPKDSRWKEEIYSIIAENESIGPIKLERALANAIAKDPELQALDETDGMPGIIWLGRTIREFKKKNPEQKGVYTSFFWPESLKRHEALFASEPHASWLGVQLLRLAEQTGSPRPTIRQVYWACQLYKADPSMPVFRDPAIHEQDYSISRWSAAFANHDKYMLSAYLPTGQMAALHQASEALFVHQPWLGGTHLENWKQDWRTQGSPLAPK